MPRVSTGSIRCLRKSRCVETLFNGGDTAWRNDGSILYTMRGDVVKAVRVDDPLQSTTIGSEEEGLKLTSIVLDDSNTRLTVAFTNGLMRELDVSGVAPRELRSWRSLHSAPILAMAYSPLSNLLATGSSDFAVLIWDMESHRLVAKLVGPSVVSALVFISSTEVAVGYMDGTARIFKRDEEEEDGGFTLIHDLKNHSSRVTTISVDPATGFIVLSSRDQTATVVDPMTGVKKNTVLLFEACESSVIVPDSRLFTVGEEGKIKEWNMQKSKQVKCELIANEPLESISYNSVRHELMVITATKNIVFLDGETMKVKREIVGMHDEIFSVALMGDKDEFLAVASNSPELKLYETATYNCKFVTGHTASVVSLSVPHWNPSLLASCAKDNAVIVWKLDAERHTLGVLAVCSGHTSAPSSISFSHTATAPFLLSTGYDTMLKLWPLKTLPAKPAESVEAAVHLACASTLKAHAKDATCVDVSPNDAVAVTGGMDKMAKLWAVDSGSMQLGIVGTLSGHKRGIWDARFSPQGDKVATSSGDAIVRVFSVSDRSMLATLEGHTSAVLKVLFVNNGNQLLSADSGGIMRVWDVKGGVEDLAQEAHEDKIWSVCSSRKEEMYVSAGSDGRIVVWEDATELLQKEEMEKQMKHAQEVQTLDNLMADGRYKDALKFALGLDRPYCALKVVIALGDAGELGAAILDLDKGELQVLMQFTTKWNTNTKTSHPAQLVLQSVLLQIAPETLLEMPGIGGILAELLPYTKRHYDRLNKARQDVSLLNYYWKHMRVAN